MTKQFNNVDDNGNATMIGSLFVRMNQRQTMAIIGDAHLDRVEAKLLRNWLDNVLQDEKPVKP